MSFGKYLELDAVLFDDEEKELAYNILDKVSDWYSRNDVAHTIQHAIDVTILGLAMCPVGVARKEVIAACLLHDICVWQGRADHHISAISELTAGGELDDWFGELCQKYILSVNNVLFAILEHRASYDATFSTRLSEVVSSADRGRPDVVALMKRISLRNTAKDTVEHLQEKFSEKGYAKYPELYRSYFGKEFDEFLNQLEDEEYLYKLYHEVNGGS